jgi:integrase
VDDGLRNRGWHSTSVHQQGWPRLGCGFSPKVIWGVVKEKAKICEIPTLAPHDLRRTCARLCHHAGGELEQIQFLPGHVSVQTTERYLGCKQRFHNAVNDRIGLEPAPPGSS